MTSLILSSEVGVMPIPQEKIVQKDRLQSGKNASGGYRSRESLSMMMN